MKNKVTFFAVLFPDITDKTVCHYFIPPGILISVFYGYDGELDNVVIRDDTNTAKLL